jgi:hypothetical protein
VFDKLRFGYKICKNVKLTSSAGMGPVRPGLPVKLLQNIHGTVMKGIFFWFTQNVNFRSFLAILVHTVTEDLNIFD